MNTYTIQAGQLVCKSCTFNHGQISNKHIRTLTKSKSHKVQSRTRSVVTYAEEVEKFVWKGASSETGLDFDRFKAWEEPGLYVEAPEKSGVQWFFVDSGPKKSGAPTMLLLHGLPTYSYLWRNVLPELNQAGRRAVAVDLPGFGNSTMLPVGSGFDYTMEEFVSSLDSLVSALELDEKPLELVAQGMLGGTVGALWAARNPGKVSKLILMNTPLDKQTAGEIPKPFQSLLNPFVAPIFCQNPLNMVGKPIEAAGPYALDVNDQAAYLQPTLEDGNAGFIMIAVMKEIKKNGPKALEEALSLLSQDGSPEVEILWGASDNWYGEAPPAIPSVTTNVKIMNGAGQFAPEDWAEKVVDGLLGRPIKN